MASPVNVQRENIRKRLERRHEAVLRHARVHVIAELRFLRSQCNVQQWVANFVYVEHDRELSSMANIGFTKSGESEMGPQTRCADKVVVPNAAAQDTVTVGNAHTTGHVCMCGNLTGIRKRIDSRERRRSQIVP